MSAAAPQAERDRSKFLGGSDAAAVMGLSPWATPVELWQQKTGRKPKPPPDRAQEKRWARGHRLEPFIRDMAIERLEELGIEVELLTFNQTYADPEHPFLACEIDFELRLTGQMMIGNELHTFEGEHVNCDAKSVSGFARKKWGEVDTEDVPIEYAAQFMHGLMVTGRRYCLVAALRSFDDVDIFWTVRDDETIAGMRPKLVSFWVDHVLGDKPPDPMVFDDIKALFPNDDGQVVEASARIAVMVDQLRQVKSEIKALEDGEKALTFDIAEAISPHAILTYQGKEIASWKGQNDTRLDQALLAEAKLFTYDEKLNKFLALADPVGAFKRTKIVRVLRLKKPKA